MPDKAGSDLLELVKNDLFKLRLEWRLYRSLFGTNKETVDLLNSISVVTSSTLEQILFERVLLGIRKLTDPPKAARRNIRSVTVSGLGEFYENDNKDLARLVSHAKKSAKFARNWSDKRIAHSDLEYRTGASSLLPASRAKVEQAIDAIAGIVRWIERTHFGVVLNTHPIQPPEDEGWLLRCLWEGKMALDEKERRSRQLSREGRVTEGEKLFDIPWWLEREEPPLDMD